MPDSWSGDKKRQTNETKEKLLNKLKTNTKDKETNILREKKKTNKQTKQNKILLNKQMLK